MTAADLVKDRKRARIKRRQMYRGYVQEIYEKWNRERVKGQIVLRGRVLKVFREKRRLVLIFQSGGRYRLIWDRQKASCEEIGGLQLCGALMAVRAATEGESSDMVTAQVEDYMIVSLPSLPGAQRCLSSAGTGGSFHNTFYHLKMCGDESTIRYMRLRHKVLYDIRSFLNGQGFCECAVPMLQKNYHGGDAIPFTTHVNYAHRDYYLKPNSQDAFLLCLAGGMEEAYEISDYFRNGGRDSFHTVPYCALELYAAYRSYEEIKGLAWKLFRRIVASVEESVSGLEDRADYPAAEGSFSEIAFTELLSGTHHVTADEAGIRSLRRRLTGKTGDSVYDNAGWVYKWMKKELFPAIHAPAAVIDLPAGISPFVKTVPGSPWLLKRGYVVWGGSNVIEFFEGNVDDYEKIFAQIECQERIRRKEGGKVRRDYSALRHAFALGIPPYSSLTVSLERMIAIGFGEAPVSAYRMNL